MCLCALGSGWQTNREMNGRRTDACSFWVSREGHPFSGLNWNHGIMVPHPRWGDHFGYPGGPPIFRNLKNDFTCFCPSNRDDFCLLQNLLGIWVSLWDTPLVCFHLELVFCEICHTPTASIQLPEHWLLAVRLCHAQLTKAVIECLDDECRHSRHSFIVLGVCSKN